MEVNDSVAVGTQRSAADFATFVLDQHRRQRTFHSPASTDSAVAGDFQARISAAATELIVDPAFLPHLLQNQLFANVIPSYQEAVRACANSNTNQPPPDTATDDSATLAADGALQAMRAHLDALLAYAMQVAKVADGE